jgi:CheY-like chemotaxis protein/two-component sensor histidine kinase
VEDARRKDQWIAMLGHELRNPIGAISAGVELLDGGAAANQERVRAMLRRQLKQVGRLLDDLLDAARIIAGKLEIAREPVDMTGVAEAAVEATASLMKEKRHRVSVELPAPGEVMVLGDDARLMEVVVNLLTNAAKYTEPGGKISVSVSVEADGDTATLSVRDDGVGIAAELMPRIFDVFTQGPRNLGRANKGLGLGLPLVRNIIELHAGRVEAFSAGEGKGSLFEITLPRIDPSMHARPSSSMHVSGAASPLRVARAATPLRVLVAEDNGDAASMLAQVLRHQGHETRVAHSGPAALTAAAEFKPDVVLLDLGLPEMDGYEVAKRLRAGDATLLLIAVTGYQNDEAQLREAGFDRHILKPLDFTHLAAWLGNWPTA